jgi:hypothetical protein
MLGTNLCQMVTPILVLLIVLILKEVSKSNIEFMAEFSIYLPVPYLFHLPYEPLSNFGKVFNISDCEQWYFVEFLEEADQETKEFFGYNTGFPMHKPESEGMLSNKNVMTFPCRKAGKTTPWFEVYDESKYEDRPLNQYVFDTIG